MESDREKEREGGGERERKSATDRRTDRQAEKYILRVCVCVRVCMCV